MTHIRHAAAPLVAVTAADGSVALVDLDSRDIERSGLTAAGLTPRQGWHSRAIDDSESAIVTELLNAYNTRLSVATEPRHGLQVQSTVYNPPLAVRAAAQGNSPAAALLAAGSPVGCDVLEQICTARGDELDGLGGAVALEWAHKALRTALADTPEDAEYERQLAVSALPDLNDAVLSAAATIVAAATGRDLDLDQDAVDTLADVLTAALGPLLRSSRSGREMREAALNAVRQKLSDAATRAATEMATALDSQEDVSAAGQQAVREARRLLGRAVEEFVSDRAMTAAATPDEIAASIAHSTAQTAIEGARLAAAKAVGARVSRTWISRRDEIVRPIHKDADGQIVASTQPFKIDDEFVRFPGDPEASARNARYCRCRLLWREVSSGKFTFKTPNEDIAIAAAGLEDTPDPEPQPLPDDEIFFPNKTTYLVQVDPEDPTAVMELVAIMQLPSGTSAGMRWGSTSWVSDDRVLQEVMSGKEVFIPLNADAVKDVVGQISSVASAYALPSANVLYGPRSEMISILAAGGADRNRGNAEVLRRYWTTGRGAAKIGWRTSGDFTRCFGHLSKYMGERAKGWCALRHREMNGFWPGSRLNK